MRSSPAAKPDQQNSHLSASLERLKRCGTRDDVLAALGEGLKHYLAHARVYEVQGNQLRGLVSVDKTKIDTSAIRSAHIAFTHVTVGGRTVRDGVPYIGPLPPSDPFVKLFPKKKGKPVAAVIVPITLGNRTVCLLVGRPEGPASPELRDQVLQLTAGAADALARVLAQTKEGGSDRVPRSNGARSDSAAQVEVERAIALEGGKEERDGVTERAGSAIAETDIDVDQADFFERRTSVRLPHVVEVTHTSDHNFFVGFMEDISEGGLFVATYAPIQLGEQIELSFRLPGLEQTQVVQCRVRWVREHNPLSPDMIPGVGVSFLDLSEAATEAIHRFIQQRGAIFYED